VVCDVVFRPVVECVFVIDQVQSTGSARLRECFPV
jgi:hypothetical protein